MNKEPDGLLVALKSVTFCLDVQQSLRHDTKTLLSNHKSFGCETTSAIICYNREIDVVAIDKVASLRNTIAVLDQKRVTECTRPRASSNKMTLTRNPFRLKNSLQKLWGALKIWSPFR